MKSMNTELSQLRQAVFTHQWKDCKQRLCSLLARNSAQGTLLVADEMVLSSLKLQSLPQPDLESVYEFAEQITSFIKKKQSPSQILPYPVGLEQGFNADLPGASEFKRGVEALWKSLSAECFPPTQGRRWILPETVSSSSIKSSSPRKFPKPDKAGYLVYALSSFITSELCQYWANAYSEEWALMQLYYKVTRESATMPLFPENVDYTKMRRGLRFLSEPESVGYKAARWLALADKMESLCELQAPL